MSITETDSLCEERQSVLTILHFNDAYEIGSGTDDPVGGAARFGTALKKHQPLNPLVAFSGDCLSPSLLSTTTKGKHMVDILNKLGVHCAVYGNHEFDFGVDVLEEMRTQMTFPWFLSNIFDNFTSQTLGHGNISSIVEWNGLKIGLMGLVEEGWLEQLGTVDRRNVHYVDYVKTANQLSAELRQQGADLVIALTHMRWHNDIRLASESVGLDLILGGHDHEYRVMEVNNVHIVKSGTEFRFLSRLDVVRREDGTFQFNCTKVSITSDLEEDVEIKEIVDQYNNSIQHMLQEVLCHVDVELDGRCATVRRKESNLGNLITNAMLEATQAEVAFLNSGTLRSDRFHPAGPLTMQDLMQILPLMDLVLVVDATGQQLYEGLENGVRNYPALDGRFPQVAGIQFGFDPKGKPGHRVKIDTVKVQGKSLDLNRTYLVAMKEYMIKGKDGYTMFNNCNLRLGVNNAQILSTILINHFETTQMIRGLKPCKSGHRMGLITASSIPSVTPIEGDVTERLAGEVMSSMGVVMVPGVEGRIFHILTENESDTCVGYSDDTWKSPV